jgi:hypothetical protein
MRYQPGIGMKGSVAFDRAQAGSQSRTSVSEL